MPWLCGYEEQRVSRLCYLHLPVLNASYFSRTGGHSRLVSWYSDDRTGHQLPRLSGPTDWRPGSACKPVCFSEGVVAFSVCQWQSLQPALLPSVASFAAGLTLPVHLQMSFGNEYPITESPASVLLHE